MNAKLILALVVLLPVSTGLLAAQARECRPAASPELARDRRALEIFLATVERNVISAAEAMPADKYKFVPVGGEFRGVRSFGAQVKHLAATNYILAAAALGTGPPAHAGDEAGPDSVNSKPEVLAYAKGSFAELHKAVARVGEPAAVARSSPISPLRGDTATALGLVVESLIHAYDHYGQMIEYLRMNDVVPPASRP